MVIAESLMENTVPGGQPKLLMVSLRLDVDEGVQATNNTETRQHSCLFFGD
jgi:hypothetical protein